MPEPCIGGLTDGTPRERGDELRFEGVALAHVIDSNAAEPEGQIQQFANSGFDGTTVRAGGLLLAFPVTLASAGRETGRLWILSPDQGAANVAPEDAAVLRSCTASGNDLSVDHEVGLGCADDCRHVQLDQSGRAASAPPLRRRSTARCRRERRWVRARKASSRAERALVRRPSQHPLTLACLYSRLAVTRVAGDGFATRRAPLAGEMIP
jgi:hypothetical protein